MRIRFVAIIVPKLLGSNSVRHLESLLGKLLPLPLRALSRSAGCYLFCNGKGFSRSFLYRLKGKP